MFSEWNCISILELKQLINYFHNRLVGQPISWPACRMHYFFTYQKIQLSTLFIHVSKCFCTVKGNYFLFTPSWQVIKKKTKHAFATKCLMLAIHVSIFGREYSQEYSYKISL